MQLQHKRADAALTQIYHGQEDGAADDVARTGVRGVAHLQPRAELQRGHGHQAVGTGATP